MPSSGVKIASSLAKEAQDDINLRANTTWEQTSNNKKIHHQQQSCSPLKPPRPSSSESVAVIKDPFLSLHPIKLKIETQSLWERDSSTSQCRVVMNWLTTFDCFSVSATANNIVPERTTITLDKHSSPVSHKNPQHYRLNDVNLYKILCEIDDDFYHALNEFIDVDSENMNSISVIFLYKCMALLTCFFQSKYDIWIDLKEFTSSSYQLLQDIHGCNHEDLEIKLKEQLLKFLQYLVCTVFISKNNEKLVNRILTLDFFAQKELAQMVKEVMEGPRNECQHSFNDVHILFELVRHAVNNRYCTLQKTIFLNEQIIEKQHQESVRMYLENVNLQKANQYLRSNLEEVVMNFSMERTNLLEKLGHLESQFEEYHVFKKAYEKYDLISQENLKLKRQLNDLTLEIHKIREESSKQPFKTETPNSKRHVNRNNLSPMNEDSLLTATDNNPVVDYFEEEMRELTSAIQQMNLEMNQKDSKIDALVNENKHLKVLAANYQNNNHAIQPSLGHASALPNVETHSCISLYDDLKCIIEERQTQTLQVQQKQPPPEPILKINMSTQTPRIPTIYTHSQFTSTKDLISTKDFNIQLNDSDLLSRPSPADICLNSPSPPIPSQLAIISNHLAQANTAILADRFKDFSTSEAIHAAKLEKSQNRKIRMNKSAMTPAKSKKTLSDLTTKSSSSPIMVQSNAYVDPKSLPYFDNQYRVFIQEHSYERFR
ncbi:hypothetical protein C9374_014671 [Naegleria lovaniensis]|uniref:Uncharacterized protein n=1 Tax=Naegleria lovaniensis TaxID=51637 RepID=A0AA88H088_NAELO|nr:uncharacterized protein C9374_014671 [Naegleria lovaniensis]KAG2389271.1 hypothetical protein C9374_014671 [Naegleria lovaniensis]